MDILDEKKVEKIKTQDGNVYERHSVIKHGGKKVWWEAENEYGPVESDLFQILEKEYYDLFDLDKPREIVATDLVSGYYIVCSKCSKVVVSVDTDGVEFLELLNIDGWKSEDGVLLCSDCCAGTIEDPIEEVELKIQPDENVGFENIEKEDIVTEDQLAVELDENVTESNVVEELYSAKCDGCDFEVTADSPEKLKDVIESKDLKRVNDQLLCTNCRRKSRIARERKPQSIYGIKKPGGK